MSKPLVIELFCGMFGWSAGWLALGGEAIGFDIEHQPYHGPVPKGAHLVLQDVLTLHGSQFKDAALILASSPCQAYSYMAMPWTRAKQIARALRGQDVFPDGYEGYTTIAELNALFEAPKRIQREACEAAGRYIPMIQENVRGAIPWVGRSQWNFGSYHLWGDVPALMPIPHKAVKLGGGASWYPPSDPRHQPGLDFTRLAGQKSDGSGWRENGTLKSCNRMVPDGSGLGKKNVHFGSYADRKAKGDTLSLTSSKSPQRKAASAQIAKIPYPLASWIASCYYPCHESDSRKRGSEVQPLDNLAGAS